MGRDFSKLEVQNINPADVLDEEFYDFLIARSDYWTKQNRVSVAELEAEFETKSNYLLYNEHYELCEIGLYEFVDTLFDCGGSVDLSSDVPFEEIQSYEYRYWIDQKKRLKSLESESPTSDKVDYSGYRMWRYNPVIFYKEGKKKNRHRLLLKEDEDTMTFLENRDFAIMSPVTYVGRTNSYRNARFLYAIAIDLDGVGVGEVQMLLRGMTTGVYPVANIIVNSGHGIHVYYLLERPLEMYETRINALNKLKRGLTKIVWLVSKLGAERAQVQSVVQGFRVPGTKTKFGKPIRAFWNASVPLHTPEELNTFLGRTFGLTDEELGILKDKIPYNPSRVTLKEAKERWPEWYASKVIGKKRVGKKWKLNRGLYDWWLNILKDGQQVEVHHRYWCILTLVVYAVKCGVPRDEVRADALSLVPSFDRKTKTVDNPFTEDDVEDALRAYDEEYNKWPLKVIETTTGIRIEKNRRNGRKQKIHLKGARALRDVYCEDKGMKRWDENSGRKKETIETSPHAAIVREWREKNPDNKNKSRCARDTGLTRPTVHRWWNE